MADELNPPAPAPPPKQPVQQQAPQAAPQQATPAISFSPSTLVNQAVPNPFNPNPAIIAEAGERGISPSRFADAAGPISRSGSGYSYMTGRGSKVDVAGTPNKPRPTPAAPPAYGGGSDYTAQEYF